jgi:segregation and condensation protein B
LTEAARNFENDSMMDDETPAVSPEADMMEACRIAEALIFASSNPVEESELAKHMPDGVDLEEVMQLLRAQYDGRGFNLARVAKKWTFRTAADLGWLLSRETTQQKKLSRAALETLAICAYHQPVTRADIEEIRGVAISKGTLDVLMETGWVRLRGRRKSPGRPVTYGTTEDFLLHFGLEIITDLPGLDELKGAGLFDGRLPGGFGIPTPNDNPDLADDEDPLDDDGGDDLLGYAAINNDDPDDQEAEEPVLDQVSASNDSDGIASDETPDKSVQTVSEP